MTMLAVAFLDIAVFFTLGTLWLLLVTFVVFLYRHLWRQERRGQVPLAATRSVPDDRA